MNDEIWLATPPDEWNEGFPVGNGALGGMVYGNVEQERIGLNADTLWSGTGKDKTRMGSSSALHAAREQVLHQGYRQAEEILQKDFLGEWNESYMPLGDLLIDTLHTSKTYQGYRRRLQLDTAICTTEYSVDNAQHERTVYCSQPHDALVVCISAAVPTDYVISLDSKLEHTVCADSRGRIIMQGTAPSHVEPSYQLCDTAIEYDKANPGMPFCAYAGVKTDGTVLAKGSCLNILGAYKTVLYLTAKGGYDAENNKPITQCDKLTEACEHTVEHCLAREEKDLRREHVQDYTKLYSRTSLQLADTENTKPTDERILAVHEGADDCGLLELWFNFGRYLMIACSRSGSMAANLQGIWNNEMRAPWSSNYTTNINTQMNYWAAEVCNLPECHMPLMKLISDCVPSGRRTAQEQFGCRGFVFNHNIDIWRQTSPVGRASPKMAVKYGYFPMASGWLCTHIMEHYRYTQDKAFLEQYYPIMRECAEFYLDYLVEVDGKLTTVPSTSPENLFLDSEGHECAVSTGSAMDIAIIRTLFNDCCMAAGELCVDAPFSAGLKEAIARLPQYKVSQSGCLLEWDKDFNMALPQHRHISHLFGLYPAADIDIVEHPQLARACECALNERTDMGPGWSKAWKACLWARLGAGDRAYGLLRGLLTPITTADMSYKCGGSYKNMLCAHPPFQIDGNFGATAAIAELLLQSHRGYIELLPALPRALKNGRATGLVARGGYELAFTWHNSRVIQLSVLSHKFTSCKILLNGTLRELKCVINSSVSYDFANNPLF